MILILQKCSIEFIPCGRKAASNTGDERTTAKHERALGRRREKGGSAHPRWPDRERERWSGSQRLFTPDRPIQGFHEENCKQNQWGLTRTGRQEHNKIFLQSSNATDYQELCKQLLLYFQNLYFFDDRVCERTCLFLGGKEFIEIISFDHFCAHLYDKKYGESW